MLILASKLLRIHSRESDRRGWRGLVQSDAHRLSRGRQQAAADLNIHDRVGEPREVISDLLDRYGVVIFFRVHEVKFECRHFYVFVVKVIMLLLATFGRVWTKGPLLWSVVDLLESREVCRVAEITSSSLRCEISVPLSFWVTLACRACITTSRRAAMHPAEALLAWWAALSEIGWLLWQSEVAITVNTACRRQILLLLLRIPGWWW